MPTNKTSRARNALRSALLAALIVLAPFVASAQDSDGGAPGAPSLTPPSLLPGVEPTLPELPVGSAPTEVVLELTVAVDGSASDAVVLRSSGAELDAAALAAVSSLKFQPALRDGTPIPARIPFRFTFQPAAPPPPPPVTPPPAAEPETPPETEGLTLDVQGERPPRETTVHAIAREEAQKLPGTGGDPLRAIESLPGVARPPAAEAMFVVRGSAPGDSAIFVDGIQIPLAYHFGGISSVVPNDALGRLDFRPGNFGAEYGRAMGGVVDLGLRAPRRDRLGGVAQLDTVDGRLMLEGPLGSRTRFLASARRSWVDAWIGKVDEDIKSAPVYYDAQVMLEHDLTNKTTARLLFFGADDRMKLIFDEPIDNDPAASKLNLGTRFTRLALRFDSQLTDRVSLRQTYSWGTDGFEISTASEYQDISAHTLDARLELRARFADWVTGTVGLDSQVSKYHVRLRVRPYPTTDEVEGPAFSRPTRQFDERVWMARPALYAMLELTPLPGLRIVPAVRADYMRDTEQLTLDPRVTARADVHPTFPRTTLKGGVGFYTQPPQGVESVEPFGTKGVESNRALHASVGIEQELARGLELSLEGFYKQLSNLVVSEIAEDSEALGARFTNHGEGRAYGGETLLRYRDPSGRFFGWLAYTLSRSERRSDSGESYHLFEFDQTHILSALGSYSFGRGYSLGARFRYVTGSPYTPVVGGVLDLDAGAYAPIGGPTFSGRIPAFHQLDVRFDKTWQLGKSARLTAYLELRNAYNRKNTEDIAYRYDYAESKRARGLPILPVIGLRGEL
ncbi:MAG: TonB-dependent receptor [Polyangiales bacterium]